METTQGSATTTAETGNTSQTTADSQEQGTAQGSSEQNRSQPTPQLKKFKLKVDGEEFEEELDLSNEAELTKRLQMAKAAEKRISQAKSEKQKALEILKAFEDGTLFEKHPKNRELAEKFLLKQLESEMLTPEQKRMKELEEFYNQKTKEEQEFKTRQEQEAAKAQEAKVAQQFQKTIIDALDKSGLPKTPDLAKRMAYLMKKNLELGISLSSDDLVSEVKAEITGLIQSLVGSAQGDQLVALLGDDAAKKLRAYDVQRLKAQMGQTKKSEPTVQAPKREDGRPMSLDEWKEHIRQRVKS